MKKGLSRTIFRHIGSRDLCFLGVALSYNQGKVVLLDVESLE